VPLEGRDHKIPIVNSVAMFHEDRLGKEFRQRRLDERLVVLVREDGLLR
jgi:hypothetical protein